MCPTAKHTQVGGGLRRWTESELSVPRYMVGMGKRRSARSLCIQGQVICMFLFSRDLYKRDANSDSEGYVTQEMHDLFPLTGKLVYRTKNSNVQRPQEIIYSTEYY
jgi:hypothetical protein